MAARLFVSYRRDDSQHVAGRLFDRLEAHYGAGSVFMDVDSIDPGLDFAQVIEEELDRCDVLIALIGRHWADIVDERGERRLNNPDDLVRLEIAAALKRSIPVIPVLVDGASLPRRDSLPEELAPLAGRHSSELSHPTFNADLSLLLKGMDRLFRRLQPDPSSGLSPETSERGKFGALSLDDVRNRRFRMARKNGYEVLEVDAFVDEVEEALARMLEDLAHGQADRPMAGPSSGMTLDAVRRTRFRIARKSGYEVLEVDKFVDEVEQTFAVLYEQLSERNRG